MTRWPETCGYCGAPMFRGACPRCNYRIPQPGKIVLSGVAIGQTSVGDHYVPRGTGTSNTKTLTIPNITIGQGSAIVVGIQALDNDGAGFIIQPTVTWNSLSLSGLGQSNSDQSNPSDLCEVFSRLNVIAGTGSVVVDCTTSSAGFAGVNAIVTELVRLKSPQSDPGGDHSAGPVDPSVTASMSLVAAFTNEIQVFYVSTNPGSSPVGTFDPTLTPGQIVVGTQDLTVGFGYTGSRLTEGLRIGRSGGVSLATKSFGVSTKWAMVAARLPVDGPP